MFFGPISSHKNISNGPFEMVQFMGILHDENFPKIIICSFQKSVSLYAKNAFDELFIFVQN